MTAIDRLMRIIHLSDLHFGTETPELTALLDRTLADLNPDLAIVSGDFTQTAIRSEFGAARAFLSRLPCPWMAVPGNHDIPRYDLIERFVDPYKRYRQYISKDIQPVFKTNKVCIAGINTARRIVPHWNWANGAVSPWQTDWLKRQYESAPGALRLCVMHHPVWKPEGARLDTIVFGGNTALEAMKAMKVNLVLSGHIHHAAIQTVPVDDKNKIVFLSASTALSRRLRGQKNGFNIVDLYEQRVVIELRGYLDSRFDKLEVYEHLMN